MHASKDDLAVEYSESALELLRSSSIPPTPMFYELLYTYATGTNPDLNARINTVFERGEQPGVELAEALHNEFMQPNDVGARLNIVSAEIATQIESVFGALKETSTATSSYSEVLQSVSGDLESGVDAKSIAKLTSTLLSETQKMKVSNDQLEDSLENAHSDVETLQREIDELRRESLIDPLTKINNRKSFDTSLKKGVEEARKDGTPLSLIMTDIDHFKKFNDTYGHQTGDQVLRLVAMTLNANVMPKDTAARYGGEEFAIVLPQTPHAQALTIAEKMREAIQSRSLMKKSTNEKLGRVTSSFGVATLSNGDTADSLVERADECLYAAKSEGRNRVISEDSNVMKTAKGKQKVA